MTPFRERDVSLFVDAESRDVSTLLFGEGSEGALGLEDPEKLSLQYDLDVLRANIKGLNEQLFTERKRRLEEKAKLEEQLECSIPESEAAALRQQVASLSRQFYADRQAWLAERAALEDQLMLAQAQAEAGGRGGGWGRASSGRPTPSSQLLQDHSHPHHHDVHDGQRPSQASSAALGTASLSSALQLMAQQQQAQQGRPPYQPQQPGQMQGATQQCPELPEALQQARDAQAGAEAEARGLRAQVDALGGQLREVVAEMEAREARWGLERTALERQLEVVAGAGAGLHDPRVLEALGSLEAERAALASELHLLRASFRNSVVLPRSQYLQLSWSASLAGAGNSSAPLVPQEHVSKGAASPAHTTAAATAMPPSCGSSSLGSTWGTTSSQSNNSSAGGAAADGRGPSHGGCGEAAAAAAAAGVVQQAAAGGTAQQTCLAGGEDAGEEFVKLPNAELVRLQSVCSEHAFLESEVSALRRELLASSNATTAQAQWEEDLAARGCIALCLEDYEELQQAAAEKAALELQLRALSRQASAQLQPSATSDPPATAPVATQAATPQVRGPQPGPQQAPHEAPQPPSLASLQSENVSLTCQLVQAKLELAKLREMEVLFLRDIKKTKAQLHGLPSALPPGPEAGGGAMCAAATAPAADKA